MDALTDIEAEMLQGCVSPDPNAKPKWGAAYGAALDFLVEDGLLTHGPLHQITEKGRQALDAYNKNKPASTEATSDARSGPGPGEDGNYGYAHDPHDQSRDDAERAKAHPSGDFLTPEERELVGMLDGTVPAKHWPQPLRDAADTILRLAREKVDLGALQRAIDYRLNEHLCGMKPNFDDSMTGFNEAWEIVSGVFKKRAALLAAGQTKPGADAEQMEREDLASEAARGPAGTADLVARPVAWRWHWNSGDEPDVWGYSETEKVSDAQIHAEPLYPAFALEAKDREIVRVREALAMYEHEIARLTTERDEAWNAALEEAAGWFIERPACLWSSAVVIEKIRALKTPLANPETK